MALARLDNGLLASGYSSGFIKLWPADGSQLLLETGEAGDEVAALDVMPGSKSIVAAWKSSGLRLLDARFFN